MAGLSFRVLIFVVIFSGLVRVTPAAAKLSPSSGKQLCSALTVADFNKAGVPVTSLENANVDNDASAYCVYASKAGKVEFDIFYPAGADDNEIKATERTVLKEVGGKFDSISLAGADSAAINLVVPGKEPSASIAVRWKSAVFTINVPGSNSARQQLTSLSQIVLDRLQH